MVNDSPTFTKVARKGRGFERFERVPNTDVESTQSSEGDNEDQRVNKAGASYLPLLRKLGIVLALCAISFLAGRVSVQGETTNMGDARHVVSFNEETTPRKKPPAMIVAPDQYLATFSTEIFLVNLSRTGDGWAPWQLAVSGNACLRGGFCEKSSHVGSDCPNNTGWRNPQWKAFNVDKTTNDTEGVWALYIDPEAELARGEAYAHEEIIETRLQLTITNSLREPTLMHFHGFVPPNNLDGIPWISANPIQPNTTVFYDFMVYHRGFYWMHSHFGHHAGSGLFAPMIVKDHPNFTKKIGNPTDVLMVIVDAHWRAECAYARHLFPDDCPVGGFDGWPQYTFNVNGHSLQGKKPSAAIVNVSVGEGIRLRILDAGTMAVYRISLGNLSGQLLATDGRRVKNSTLRITEFPLTSANRLDILVKIPHEGCFPIEAVRAGASNISENKAERGVLILKTPNWKCPDKVYNPVVKTEVTQTSCKEVTDLHRNYTALTGLLEPHRRPDKHHIVRLTGKYRWKKKEVTEWIPDFTLNNRKWRVWPAMVWCKVPECKHPEQCEKYDQINFTVLKEEFCQDESLISNVRCNSTFCDGSSDKPDDYGRCLGKKSSVWSDRKINITDCHLWKLRPDRFKYNQHPLKVCHGDRVWITFIDNGTVEAHPVHLHGTHQQLIYIGNTPVNGTMQDTWFAYKESNFTVAFDALNPGEWLLHCHIEHHLMNGMATTLRYVMDGRCRKRLDTQRDPKWRHTRTVPPEEWPSDWHELWHKIKPKSSIKGR